MEIFKTNTKLEKCFKTSDGEHFYNESDAKNYAKSLENKHVEKLVNPEFVSQEADQKQVLTAIQFQEEQEIDITTSSQGTTKGDELDIDEKKAEQMASDLENLELSTNNYQEMKRLVKYYEIEVPDNKAETLISALNDYKSKIQA